MIKQEVSIIIKRPVEEVFDYVSNLANTPQWQTGLYEIRPLSPGPLGAGSKFAAVRKILGRKVESVVEISVYEPYRKLVIKGSDGSTPFEEVTYFDPVSEGTQLSSAIELQTSGLMGLAEPLIVGSIKREFDADRENLKDLLEQQVAVALS